METYLPIPKTSHGLLVNVEVARPLRVAPLRETLTVAEMAQSLWSLQNYAEREGAAGIRASVKELGEFANHLYSSAKRSISRLRKLGWIHEPESGVVVFVGGGAQ